MGVALVYDERARKEWDRKTHSKLQGYEPSQAACNGETFEEAKELARTAKVKASARAAKKGTAKATTRAPRRSARYPGKEATTRETAPPLKATGPTD